MRFSSRSDYGLILMGNLARKWGKGPVSLKTIAEEEGLSFLYLEQLAASLRKEGLIKGNRGAAGGYTLARKPEDIRVSDVVWALEDHGLVRCTGPKGECARAGHCTGKAVWTRLEEILDEAMDRLTLADVSGLSGDHASSDAAYAHAPA